MNRTSRREKHNQSKKGRPVNLQTQIGEKDIYFFFILKIQGKKAVQENMKVVREVFHIENWSFFFIFWLNFLKICLEITKQQEVPIKRLYIKSYLAKED